MKLSQQFPVSNGVRHDVVLVIEGALVVQYNDYGAVVKGLTENKFCISRHFDRLKKHISSRDTYFTWMYIETSEIVTLLCVIIILHIYVALFFEVTQNAEIIICISCVQRITL